MKNIVTILAVLFVFNAGTYSQTNIRATKKHTSKKSSTKKLLKNNEYHPY